MTDTVVTIGFRANAQGFTVETEQGATAMAWVSTNGNPAGCLRWLFNPAAPGECGGGEWSLTATYDELLADGRTGRTIFGIKDASIQSKCNIFDNGAVPGCFRGPVYLVDGSKMVVLSALRGFGATYQWVTDPGRDLMPVSELGVTVGGLHSPSSNSVTITIAASLVAGKKTPCEISLLHDNLKFTISHS